MAIVLVSVFLHSTCTSVHFKTFESKKLLNKKISEERFPSLQNKVMKNFHWFYVNPGLSEQAFEQPASGVGCTKGE